MTNNNCMLFNDDISESNLEYFITRFFPSNSLVEIRFDNFRWCNDRTRRNLKIKYSFCMLSLVWRALKHQRPVCWIDFQEKKIICLDTHVFQIASVSKNFIKLQINRTIVYALLCLWPIEIKYFLLKNYKKQMENKSH